MRRVGDVQILMAGYHAPDGAHPDFVPLQIAAEALADEPSGRLYKALVETGLASQVGVQTLQQRDPGTVIFFAMVREDASLDAARAAMIAVARRPRGEPDHGRRSRAHAQPGAVRLRAADEQLAIRRVQLSSWAAIGDWRLMFLDRDRVRDSDAWRRSSARRSST